jgi:Predicted transcriptional regulator
MRAAAELVDRDFKEVHRNLTELERLNVIEFEESGRAKRPVVRFDEIDVEVSLTAPETDTASA